MDISERSQLLAHDIATTYTMHRFQKQLDHPTDQELTDDEIKQHVALASDIYNRVYKLAIQHVRVE